VTRRRTRFNVPRNRLHVLLPFFFAISLLILPDQSFGRDGGPKPTLHVVLDFRRTFISVTFSGGKPDAKKALDPAEWRVVAIPRDPAASAALLALTPEFIKNSDGTINQTQVRLSPPSGQLIPDTFDLIIVQFNPRGIALTAMWKSDVESGSVDTSSPPAVKQNPNSIVAASSKQNAAFYFSGLYSPSIGSPPQYSIDAFVNPQFQLSSTNPCNPELGLNAQIKTNQRPTVDPDSYIVAPTFSMFIHGCGAPSATLFFGQAVLLSWNIFGPEFEAKGKDLNLVSAPMLTDFFRIWPLWSKGTSTKEPFTLYLSPTIGLELGTNIKNGSQPSGSGTIFRGVAGVDLSARFLPPKSFIFTKVLLSASYRARMPAFSEISTNTITLPGNSKPQDVFSLSSATRNHIQSELDFMFTDAWGITLKHEYGRIPPAFRLVNNTASIGLVLMFSQAGNNKQKSQP